MIPARRRRRKSARCSLFLRPFPFDFVFPSLLHVASVYHRLTFVSAASKSEPPRQYRFPKFVHVNLIVSKCKIHLRETATVTACQIVKFCHNSILFRSQCLYDFRKRLSADPLAPLEPLRHLVLEVLLFHLVLMFELQHFLLVLVIEMSLLGLKVFLVTLLDSL